MEYSQLAVTSVTALIVALLSAWVTVRLAYRRFRQEKWWERRFDAYDRVIDALYRTKEVWDSDIKEAAGESKLPAEEEQRHLAQYNEAKREIERAVALGEYVLGSAARDRLQDYRTRIRRAAAQDWPESLLDSATATGECLDDLILLARQDLRANDAPRWIGARRPDST